MGDLLQLLDETIENHLLPAIVGTNNITQPERNLYSLPIRLWGLGIPILTDTAELEFSTFVEITVPLAAIMILQGTNLPDPEEGTAKAVEQAKEKGASSWLSTLPLEDQGFTLNKGEFRDALAIRYNADLRGLPAKSVASPST